MVEVANVFQRNARRFPCGKIEHGGRPIPGWAASRRHQAPIADALVINSVSQRHRTGARNRLLGSAIQWDTNQLRIWSLPDFDQQALASRFHTHEVAGALTADLALCSYCPNTPCCRNIERVSVRRGGHLFDVAFVKGNAPDDSAIGQRGNSNCDMTLPTNQKCHRVCTNCGEWP